MSNRIALNEEHAVVNAAFLATVRIAFPAAQLLWVAEPNHLGIVRRLSAREGVTGMETEAISINPRPRNILDTLRTTHSLTKLTLGLARAWNAGMVIFLSIDGPLLLSLKIVLRTSFKDLTVLAMAHSILQSIQKRPPLKPWNHLIWFRNVLRWGGLDRLKIIVPGESIRKITLHEIPAAEPYVHALNLPYFFPPAEVPIEPIDRRVRFGFLGVATRRKGIDFFFQLAQEVITGERSCGPEPQFTVIGRILDQTCRDMAGSYVSAPSTDTFLPLEEMMDLVRPVHYAVFPYVTEEYQLVASAAFLDALAYVKPIIAVRNPYFEYIFEQMGDIGYMVHSQAEIKDVVRDILSCWPPQVYTTQCENIINGRLIFTPAYLASQLESIVNS